MRNSVLFEDHTLTFASACSFLLHFLSDVPILNRRPRLRLLFSPQVDVGRPYGFFDGVAQCGARGAGGLLLISQLEYYEISLYIGKGSNTRAELLALGGLLFFARHLNLTYLQVFGDSRAVVDWAKGLNALRVASLGHWMKWIKSMMGLFINLDYNHISHHFIKGMIFSQRRV